MKNLFILLLLSFSISISAQSAFNPKGFSIIGGIGTSIPYGDYETSFNDIGFNLLIGGNYRFNQVFALEGSIAYHYISNDFDAFAIEALGTSNVFGEISDDEHIFVGLGVNVGYHSPVFRFSFVPKIGLFQTMDNEVTIDNDFITVTNEAGLGLGADLRFSFGMGASKRNSIGFELGYLYSEFDSRADFTFTESETSVGTVEIANFRVLYALKF